MEIQASESSRKRIMHDSQLDGGDGAAASDSEMAQREEYETNVAGSEEVELSIAYILEKIDRFTEMDSRADGEVAGRDLRAAYDRCFK